MFLEKRIPIFGNRKKVDPDEKNEIFERMLETNEQLIKPASATKLSTNFPYGVTTAMARQRIRIHRKSLYGVTYAPLQWVYGTNLREYYIEKR